MKRLFPVLVLGSCGFLGGAAAVGLGPRLSALIGRLEAAGPSGQLPSAVGDLNALGDRFELVARRLSPAVVSIEAVKTQTPPNRDGKPRPDEDAGSGVLIP